MMMQITMEVPAGTPLYVVSVTPAIAYPWRCGPCPLTFLDKELATKVKDFWEAAGEWVVSIEQTVG
jgi:hypothetical protein